MTEQKAPLGGRHVRIDALSKLSGECRYVADISLPGMLHAAVAIAPQAPGRLLSLDSSRAGKMPGVRAVITAPDLPAANLVGVIFPDQPLLVEDRIRMVGDRLALVAAENAEMAWEAARAVDFEIEEEEGVYDCVRALEPASPTLHGDSNLLKTFHVLRGEVEAEKDAAAVTVEAEYHIGGQDHAYLETQGCLAVPEGDRITIIASCQCPFYIQHAVSRVLGIPLASVRVEQAATGGAFGGKEDYPSEPAACAAVLAWKTRRPVRLIYPREFDLQVSTKRHAMVIRHHWGADAGGRLRFAEVDCILDGGAYAGLSTVVAERANVSAIGPYDVPAVKVETRIALTNNLFGGAYRGFGQPQVSVAAEATMDRLARKLGMDPLEFRRINALDDERNTTCTGQALPQPVMALPCLDRATEMAEASPASRKAPESWLRGRGIGLSIYGINLHRGGQFLDRSSAVVILQPDASLIVRIGLTEMGQGVLTSIQTVAAQAMGLPVEKVQVWQPDTTTVADSGPTVASRGTHSAGRAVLDAVRRLRERLDPIAAKLLGCDAGEIRLEAGSALDSTGEKKIEITEVVREMSGRRIESIATGWYRSEDRIFDEATGQGEPYSSYAVACHVADVAVDPELGLVRVERVCAAHDIGKVIHRTGAEGQVQGGIVQAMGWVLTEDLKLEKGRLINPTFTDYLIPTSDDVPAFEIALLEDAPGRGPFGAKGLGEPSFIPAGAAIRNAVSQALGVEIDRTPLLPPTIVEAMGETHPLAELIRSIRG